MYKLILKDIFSGEEFKTEVETKEEIVSYSIGYSQNTDETIIYVFESNVELFRISGYIKSISDEEIVSTMEEYYEFIIY